MSGGTASWTVCECVCVARTQIPHFYCIFSFPDITQAIPARCHGHSTKTDLKIFKPLLLSATFLLSKKCRRIQQGPSIRSISPSPVHQTKRRGNKRRRSPIRSSSLHWMTTGKLRPWQGEWGKKISTTVSLTKPASKHLVGEKLMEKTPSVLQILVAEWNFDLVICREKVTAEEVFSIYNYVPDMQQTSFVNQWRQIGLLRRWDVLESWPLQQRSLHTFETKGQTQHQQRETR